MKPKGWRNESRRHSLARKGIKTKQKLDPKLEKDIERFIEARSVPIEKEPPVIRLTEEEMDLGGIKARERRIELLRKTIDELEDTKKKIEAKKSLSESELQAIIDIEEEQVVLEGRVFDLIEKNLATRKKSEQRLLIEEAVRKRLGG